MRADIPELQKASQEAVLLAKQAAANIVDDDEADRRHQLSLLADLIPDAVKEEATAAAGVPPLLLVLNLLRSCLSTQQCGS